MIKVLVSTLSTQGDVPGDYSFVPDGELVGRYGVVCSGERPTGHGGCGCGRGFGGFTTHRATTSAMVVERDITVVQWRDAAHRMLRETGWSGLLTDVELGLILDEMVEFDLLDVLSSRPRHGRHRAHLTATPPRHPPEQPPGPRSAALR